MMRLRVRLRLYVGIIIVVLCALLFHIENQVISVVSASVVNQPLEYSINDYFGENIFLELETKRILTEMGLEEKVGQVLMPAYESHIEVDAVASWLRDFHIGGLMVLRNDLEPSETQRILEFHDSLEEHTLPLLFSIDAEPSLMRYRLPSDGYAQATESLNTEQKSFDAGVEIGKIIDLYGFNLNFAPVYDNSKNRSVISDRSYGSDIESIAMLTSAFVRGQNQYGILTTAKHFPGHGSVTGDTHLTLQTVSGDLPEIEQFREAIESNTPFMMVGHLAVDGGQYSTSGIPATLSSKISSDLLKTELGYEGIVITDALNMGALNQFESNDENLSLQALQAGADIVLMPRDLGDAYRQIIQKMRTDQNFEKLMNEKVARIIRMKLVWQWTKNNKSGL